MAVSWLAGREGGQRVPMPVPFLGATGSNVGFRVVSSAEDNDKPMSCRLLAVKVAEDNNDNNNSFDCLNPKFIDEIEKEKLKLKLKMKDLSRKENCKKKHMRC